MHLWRYLVCLFLLNLCCAPLWAGEPTIISHNISAQHLAEDPGYEAELLILSLDKTKTEYGDYIIQPVRDDMNRARRIEMLAINRYPNFIGALPYDEALEKNSGLVLAPFPVFLGILGYRTCFISEKIRDKLAEVETKQQLVTFTQGLQKGWADRVILEHNGFRVSEAASYLSLFRMVAANRFDLFCRGANETLVEFKSHHGHIPDFTYDRSMAIYYPLPHFFYAHKEASAVLERVNKGLLLAFADGSVEALWRKYNQESIDFVQLDKRKIFHFENPHLKNLHSGFEQFVFKP